MIQTLATINKYASEGNEEYNIHIANPGIYYCRQEDGWTDR